MTKTTAQVQQEITAGEELATKIKRYYHADEPWTPKLVFTIGYKMKDIKNAASKFYKEKHMVEILNELRNYNKDDLEELLRI